MADRLAEALAAWDRGWWLTPLNGKKPILKGWTEAMRASREEVAKWAERYNLGVRGGVFSKGAPPGYALGFLDVDHGADPKWAEAAESTLCAKTQHNGRHGYFWVPVTLGNSVGKLAPHVDIRARGGQVVLAGAKGYEWVNPGAPIRVMPTEWLDQLGSAGKLHRAAESVRKAPEGHRNDTLNREAWKLRPDVAAGKVSEDAVRAALGQATSLPPVEARRTLDSALSVRVAGDERKILAPGAHANGILQTPVDFTKQVLAALAPGDVYLRNSVLGEVLDGRWAEINASRLRGVACERVEIRYLKDKGENGVKEERGILTREHAELILANAHQCPKTRRLKALCAHPVVTRDHDILGPGWHDGILVQDCEVGSPVEPWGLIEDFPLDDDARANLLALLVTLMARPALDGPAPLFIVTSATERVGKTKLLDDVVGGLVLGHALPADTWPTDPEEVRKVLVAALLGGLETLVLDNVPKTLDSDHLASFITAKRKGGRVLGRSEYVEAENTITVLASGNHVTASSEIAKRSVVISLEARWEAPELRQGFRYADLPKAVEDARAGVLGWLCALCSEKRASGLILGGFERWAALVGGCLADYPVLRQRGMAVEAMTDSDQMPVDLFRAIHKCEPESWLSSEEIAAIAAGAQWGGERLDPVRPLSTRCISLGRMLRPYQGVSFGGLRLERRKVGVGVQWRVTPSK